MGPWLLLGIAIQMVTLTYTFTVLYQLVSLLRAPRIALLVYYTALILHCSSIVVSFMLFAPFTFGYPALSSDQIKWRQWVETWDLLFRGS